MSQISLRLLRIERRNIPAGTSLLVLLFLFTFVSQQVFGTDQVIAKLGFWPGKFFTGHGNQPMGTEFTRLFSYAFVHLDVVHLALNIFGMAYFGVLTERITGTSSFLAIFMISALVSALVFGSFHFFIFELEQVSLIGASGSISALVGVAAYRRKFFPVIMWLVAEAAIIAGSILTSQPVGYFAHFGGFAAGVCLAMLIVQRKQQQLSFNRKVISES